MTDMMTLSIENIVAGYGKQEILRGASLVVKAREIVLLIGTNGSGKSTLLRVISGILKPNSGLIRFEGEDITALPTHERIAKGIAYLKQEVKVFPSLTVKENLHIAGHHLDEKLFRKRLDRVFHLFPKLGELYPRRAGLLSGGERQMLGFGLMLLHKPKLLLLDEPSAGGLTPVLAKEVFQTIQKINEEDGVSVLLVEQNIRQAMQIAHRVYLLREGMTQHEARPTEVLEGGTLEQAFFGSAIHGCLDKKSVSHYSENCKGKLL